MWLVIPAIKADLDEIIKIERECFSSPWSYQAFLQELKHYYSYLWVAKDVKSEIVGFICFWLIFNKAHILNIAVKKAFQGKGIGSLLVKKATAFVKKRGAKWVRLEVRITNKRVILFYKKLGFKGIRVSPCYYFDTGEDALVMELEL